MIIDVAAVVLVLLYTLLGYRYGLTGALLNLAAIVAGYVSALLWARPVAAELSQRTGMVPLVALPVASIGLFLLVTRGFYLLHLFVRRLMEPDKKGPSAFLTIDRMGGAGFGFLKGVALAAFLLWGLPVLAGRGEVARAIRLAESHLVSATQAVISAGSRLGFSYVVDDSNAQLVLAQLVANPRESARHAGDLMSNPKLRALSSDPAILRAVAERGAAGALATDQFEPLVADPGFQRSLKGIGFAPRDGRYVTREELGRCLDQVQRRMERAGTALEKSKTATELKAFLGDAAIQSRLKDGDVMTVLKDPRLASMIGIDLANTKLPGLDGSAGKKLPLSLPGGP
jgi:uncharacterized membrane protein required for colicin V production